jgi:hypothetical protein
VVGVVLLTRGDGGGEVVPPPPGCVAEWNDDVDAIKIGRHSYASHRYRQAHVLLLDERLQPAPEGDCAFVFPRRSLDPERVAAGLVLSGGAFSTLAVRSGGDERRLAELQSEAVDLANAELRPDGRLAPL